MKNKSLIRNGFLGFIIKCFGAGMSFFFSILISRMFDTSTVGLYYLAISVFNIAIIISKMGLENSLIKYVSIENSEKNGRTIKEIIISSIIIVSIISIILIIFIAIFSYKISIGIFHEQKLSLMIKVVILAILPNALLSICASSLKGLGKIQEGMFLESAGVPFINVVLLIIFYYVFNYKNSFVLISISYVISNIFISLVSFGVLKRNTKHLNDKKDNNFNVQVLMKTAVPLLIVASTNYLLSSTDTLMLGALKNPIEVGIYNISSKITMFPSMLLVAINSVVGPEFSIAVKNKNFDQVKGVLHTTSRIMLLIALAICSIFIIFSSYIISIFGAGYNSGQSIICIVSIGQFFVLATGPTANLLMMSGNEKHHRNITLFSAVLNILLNFLLIPNYGANGAALATTISLISKNFLTVYMVKKKLKLFIYF